MESRGRIYLSRFFFFFKDTHTMYVSVWGQYTQKMLLNLLKLELQVVVLGISIAADGNQI